MIVTGQFQLDPEPGKIFTEEELDMIESELNIFCSRLEKLSYIRYQLYVDDKVKGTKNEMAD